MVKLLRHDELVFRVDDGAARFDEWAKNFKTKFDDTPQWSIEAWTECLEKKVPVKGGLILLES